MLSLLEHNSPVRAALDAHRNSASAYAKLAFLNRTRIAFGKRAVRAAQDAGITADASVFIYRYHAIDSRQGTAYAALDAKRLLAMAAGYRKGNALMLFNSYFGIYFYILKRTGNIGLSGRSERAVIFAEMTAQAPFFININSFQFVPLILPRDLCRVFRVPFRLAQRRGASACCPLSSLWS